MAELVLDAKVRKELGKGAARRIRRQGLLPAVVYSKRLKPLHIAVDPKQLHKVLNTPKRYNAVINIKLSEEGQSQVPPLQPGGEISEG